MELEVLRISSQVDSTSGILFDVTGGKRNPGTSFFMST